MLTVYIKQLGKASHRRNCLLSDRGLQLLAAAGNGLMRAVRLMQNSSVAGPKTKTISCKTLKRSVVLRGTIFFPDKKKRILKPSSIMKYPISQLWSEVCLLKFFILDGSLQISARFKFIWPASEESWRCMIEEFLAGAYQSLKFCSTKLN